VSQARFIPNLAGQPKSGVVWHARIEQRKMERFAPIGVLLQRPQTFFEVAGGNGAQFPVRQHLTENAPAGRVVIHHEHTFALDARAFKSGITRGGGRRFEFCSEMELAAAPGSLTTHNFPPIKRHSLMDMARPRPVPP
jgi:hypothetical protein